MSPASRARIALISNSVTLISTPERERGLEPVSTGLLELVVHKPDSKTIRKKSLIFVKFFNLFTFDNDGCSNKKKTNSHLNNRGEKQLR